jgi:Spy/CpxP family protein refolding chaperone
MSSRNALIFVISSALSAGVLMADQSASTQNRQRTHEGFVGRFSSTLGLTAQQTQEAKAIFKSERDAARPVRRQLFAERTAVREAVQSGKPLPEVQQLANNEGSVLGQLAGMRAEAFAKFYAELTPAQRQKLTAMHHQWRAHHAAKSQS